MEPLHPFDVIVLPFPYTDNHAVSKRRPAVVLSHAAHYNTPTNHVMCAMITSGKHSAWVHDIPITDLVQAGLPQSCIIRLKFFTLDQRFILRVAGKLSENDQSTLKAALVKILPLRHSA